MFIKLFLLYNFTLHIKCQKVKTIKRKVVKKLEINLKKILMTVGLSAALVVAISSASFSADPPSGNSENVQMQNETESQTQPAYIIGIYKGYVAVYRYGSYTPYKITEIPVNKLTEGDIVILSKGIRINNEEELNKRLEDYTG